MSSALTESATQGVRVSTNKLASLGAIMLGMGFVLMIGFSPISAVHNAAHDTRHSAAFPCH